jgi:cysteine synthase
LVQKLTATDGFEVDIVGKLDALELLKAIRQISFNFESQKFEAHAIHAAMYQFYNKKQGTHMTAQAYLEQFTNNIDVVTLCGGTIGTFSKLAQSLAKERNLNALTLTEAEKNTLKNDAWERYLAVALLLHSDQVRYGALIREIENNYLRVSHLRSTY